MNKHYFLLLEDYHLYDDRVFRLIAEKGLKGFGLYVFILTELTRHPANKCGVNILRMLSHSLRVTFKTMMDIVTKFDLFEIAGDGDARLISSPYIDKLMHIKAHKHKKQSNAGKKRAKNALRTPGGQFTSFNQPYIITLPDNKQREEEEKETEREEDNTWEKYIDEAMNDNAWTEIQAMHSGMGKTFVERKEEIFKAFKIHIRLQGNENAIYDLYGAKSYFSNFIRKKNTRQWVLSFLEKTDARKARNHEYRFETIDPGTGGRSYYGNPIPDHAPPRPSEDYIWDNATKQWIKYS